MLTLYGWALWELGDTAKANATFDEMLGRLAERERSGQTSYQLFRERAAIYALRGERARAVGAMQAAFAHGWRLYAAWSLVDPMFASVVDDSSTVALVKRMRDDVRAMRRRLGWATSE
jgi:hypothetical protein